MLLYHALHPQPSSAAGRKASRGQSKYWSAARASLDRRGKGRRNERVQGHPGCQVVLSQTCWRGQLRAERGTGTGTVAQCRKNKKQDDQRKKDRLRQQADSPLLEHGAFGEALHHRVGKPTQFTALKRLQ